MGLGYLGSRRSPALWPERALGGSHADRVPEPAGPSPVRLFVPRETRSCTVVSLGVAASPFSIAEGEEAVLEHSLHSLHG